MRQVIKKVVFGTSLLLTSPLILAAWLERRVNVGESVFVFASQLLSLVPSLSARIYGRRITTRRLSVARGRCMSGLVPFSHTEALRSLLKPRWGPTASSVTRISAKV